MRLKLKFELNYHEQLDRMLSIKKIRQNNDVTDYTDMISIEYDTELLRLIKQCVVYDEGPIGQ